MAWWCACRSEVQEEEAEEELPGVAQGPEWGTELRICPVSGLNTLQGACPFAKPKAKAKDGGKKKKALLGSRIRGLEAIRWPERLV